MDECEGSIERGGGLSGKEKRKKSERPDGSKNSSQPTNQQNFNSLHFFLVTVVSHTFTFLLVHPHIVMQQVFLAARSAKKSSFVLTTIRNQDLFF